MEQREIYREQLINTEVAPNLLELKPVVENPESESKRVIVYCPPIMGSTIGSESLLKLAQKARGVYVVDVQKYGYPNFDQYTLQAKQIIEQLTDFDPKKKFSPH